MSDTKMDRCPHDHTRLRWMEDQWYCPKCRAEFAPLAELCDELEAEVTL